MDEPIEESSYETLVAAAETYRAALVVRLAGEAGLRTAEIPRIRPCDLQESHTASGAAVLTVPVPVDERDGDADRDNTGSSAPV
ncbi:MAG: bacterio-opsin activator, partial [Halorubrum sp.]